MPNWISVLKEISGAQTDSPLDLVRRRYLKRLHKHTDRNVIAYYSGFLNKSRIEGAEITGEDKNGFMLCIHGLDRSKGLDLLLHTPGGETQATFSLVEYLRSMFGNDIRAIIPQIAMSAGTMLACSCKSIVMGKQSSLGPIDPQFGVIAAANMLAEVRKAKEEITSNPALAMFWSPILSRITPSFIERCEQAMADSNEFLESTLRANMLSGLPKAEQDETVGKVATLFENTGGRAHDTHLHYQKCLEAGLIVERLEADPTLQDLVLTTHHCYMHTLMNTAAYKLTENHKGKALVKQIAMQPQQFIQMPQQQSMPPAMPFGRAEPVENTSPVEIKNAGEDDDGKVIIEAADDKSSKLPQP